MEGSVPNVRDDDPRLLPTAEIHTENGSVTTISSQSNTINNNNNVSRGMGCNVQGHGTTEFKLVVLTWSIWFAMVFDYLLMTMIIPIFPFLFPVHPVVAGVVFAVRPLIQIGSRSVISPLARALCGPHNIFVTALLLNLCSCLTFLAAQDESAVFKKYDAENDVKPSVGLLFLGRIMHALGSSLLMIGSIQLINVLHAKDASRKEATGLAMSGVSFGVLFGPIVGGLCLQFSVNGLPFLLVAGLFGVLVFLQILVICEPFVKDFSAKTIFPERNLGASKQLRPLDFNSQLDLAFADEHSVQVIHQHQTNPMEEGLISSSTSVSTFPNFGEESTTTFADSSPEFGPKKHFWRDPYVMSLCFLCVAGNATIAMLEPIVPKYTMEKFELKPIDNALVWFVVPFAYLVATPIASALIQKEYSIHRLILCSIGLYCLALPFATKFIWNTKHDHEVIGSLPGLIFSIMLVGAATAFIDTPSTTFLANIFTWRRIRMLGSIYAVQDASATLGYLLGPILGEILYAAVGYRSLMLGFAIGLLIVSSLISMVYLRHVPKL